MKRFLPEELFAGEELIDLYTAAALIGKTATRLIEMSQGIDAPSDKEREATFRDVEESVLLRIDEQNELAELTKTARPGSPQWHRREELLAKKFDTTNSQRFSIRRYEVRLKRLENRPDRTPQQEGMLRNLRFRIARICRILGKDPPAGCDLPLEEELQLIERIGQRVLERLDELDPQ